MDKLTITNRIAELNNLITTFNTIISKGHTDKEGYLMSIEEVKQEITRLEKELEFVEITEFNDSQIEKQIRLKKEILLYFVNMVIDRTKFRSEFKKTFFPSVRKQLEENKSLTYKQEYIIWDEILIYKSLSVKDKYVDNKYGFLKLNSNEHENTIDDYLNSQFPLKYTY